MPVRTRRPSPTNLLILRLIDHYIETHGYGPTLRDLARLASFSGPSAALHHVHRLAHLGLLTFGRTEGCGYLAGRSIHLTRQGRKLLIGK